VQKEANIFETSRRNPFANIFFASSSQHEKGMARASAEGASGENLGIFASRDMQNFSWNRNIST